MALPPVTEFEEEVAALEQRPPLVTSAPVVFYGSSSIRLWPRLATEFPARPIVNLGFGGSTAQACAHYFRRLVVPVAPAAVFFYAGDNDLALGASVEEAWHSFVSLLDQRDELLPDTSVVCLSLKPSPARRELLPEFQAANEWLHREIQNRRLARWVDVYGPMVDAEGKPRRELYLRDGLHLSRAGYNLWNELLRSEAADLLI